MTVRGVPESEPRIRFLFPEVSEITEPLPEGVRRVGFAALHPLPKWLMEEVAVRIKELNASE